MQIGDKFGEWTIINTAQKRGKEIYWLCQCSCGKIKEVNGRTLRNGTSKSCGHRESLVGKIFGNWLVLEKDERKSGGHYGTYYICQCKCGSVESVRATSLKTGKSRGCRKCCNEGNNIIDKTGQKFGLLTVIELNKELTKHSNSDAIWLCQCECGNYKNVKSSYLSQGWTKSCGCIKSSGEKEIEKILLENSINFIYNKGYFKDLLSNKNNLLRYDFIILEDNNPIRIIEFDGEQHFKEIPHFSHTLQEVKENDVIKNNYAIKKSLPLVRIPYTIRGNITFEDIFGDKYLINK